MRVFSMHAEPLPEAGAQHSEHPAVPTSERGSEPRQAYRHDLPPREDAPSANLGTSGGSPPGERVSLRLAPPLGRSPRSSRRWGKPSTGRRGAGGQQCGSAAN
jgi:hypothetical protein